MIVEHLGTTALIGQLSRRFDSLSIFITGPFNKLHSKVTDGWRQLRIKTEGKIKTLQLRAEGFLFLGWADTCRFCNRRVLPVHQYDELVNEIGSDNQPKQP